MCGIGRGYRADGSVERLCQPTLFPLETERREKYEAFKILLIIRNPTLYLFVQAFHPLAEGARYARNYTSQAE